MGRVNTPFKNRKDGLVTALGPVNHKPVLCLAASSFFAMIDIFLLYAPSACLWVFLFAPPLSEAPVGSGARGSSHVSLRLGSPEGALRMSRTNPASYGPRTTNGPVYFESSCIGFMLLFGYARKFLRELKTKDSLLYF